MGYDILIEVDIGSEFEVVFRTEYSTLFYSISL